MSGDFVVISMEGWEREQEVGIPEWDRAGLERLLRHCATKSPP